MARASKRLEALRESRAPFGSRTDVGCVRDHNEDSLAVKPPLFVVADGMGGHAAGEVASEIAVQVISDRAPAGPDAEALEAAVEEANAAILQAARDGRGREGMGTTCTAAILEGERLVIAQVGDSRAYLLHQGTLQQLTRDHSLVADMIEAGQLTPEEARNHPNRSMITRALGSAPATKPDLYEINVETGDRLLLCSDGLTSMLRDEDIERILARCHDPQRAAAQLVNEAIAAGGYDNVTVIVADVSGFAEARAKKARRKIKRNVAIVIALFLVIVGAAAFGLNYWLSTTAFLADNDGYVAIYRGVPGEFLGITCAQIEETTDVRVDDLNPGVASRLRDQGVAVESIEAAYALVASYEEDIERSKDASEDRADGETANDGADGPSDKDGSAPSDADSAAGSPAASSSEEPQQ